MWHLQSTEEFRRKFPEIAADGSAGAGEERSWWVRLRGKE
jgi:hypothetical protein